MDDAADGTRKKKKKKSAVADDAAAVAVAGAGGAAAAADIAASIAAALLPMLVLALAPVAMNAMDLSVALVLAHDFVSAGRGLGERGEDGQKRERRLTAEYGVLGAVGGDLGGDF